MQDVEAIGATAYLHEQPSVLIPDLQDTILDLHLRASLILLPKTHDRVTECRDEVHSVQHPVLAVLCLEEDGAGVGDLHF